MQHKMHNIHRKLLSTTTIRISQHSQECKRLTTVTFDHKINGFLGVIVEHFYAKFSDPSCISFSCGEKSRQAAVNTTSRRRHG